MLKAMLTNRQYWQYQYCLSHQAILILSTLPVHSGSLFNIAWYHSGNVDIVDFLNLTGVVMEANPGGVYKIGTKYGVLDQLFTRNQFSPCLAKFLAISAVPEGSLSVREAARSSSIGLGQGFFKCSCTTGCTTKRCKHKKADKVCNSRYHSSNSCKNK